jgi:hypothetical protein
MLLLMLVSLLTLIILEERTSAWDFYISELINSYLSQLFIFNMYVYVHTDMTCTETSLS